MFISLIIRYTLKWGSDSSEIYVFELRLPI